MTRFLVTALIALFAFGAAISDSARASFTKDQDALFSKSVQESNAMSVSLENIYSVYIDSGGDDILWNNAEIKKNFIAYQGYLVDFNKTLAEMTQISRSYHLRQKTAFQKEVRRRAPGKCLRRARAWAQRGEKSWQSLRQAHTQALRDKAILEAASAERWQWIQMPGSVTDGYIDGAIYDMLTGQLIALPDGIAPIFDPADLNPLVDYLYNYASSTTPVYLSSFYEYDEQALRVLRRCPRR